MEMDKAVVELKRQLRAAEEEAIREVIQDKVNAWFVGARDPVTGEYPDLPDAEDGGSRNILNPPPPTDPADEAPAAGKKEEKGDKKDKKEKKGGDEKGGGAGVAEARGACDACRTPLLCCF